VLPGQKSEGDQCLGRSRGGCSSKLHALADGLGDPLRFALTAGQAGDAPEAATLLGTVSMIAVQAVLADRAYDSDAILDWISKQDAVAVIPHHPSRATTRETITSGCQRDMCSRPELFGSQKALKTGQSASVDNGLI